MTSTHWLESRVATAGAFAELVSLDAALDELVAVEVERLLVAELAGELAGLLLEQPAISAAARTRAAISHRRII
ncbi:hypothetical protein [Mycobacterium sp. E3339]|uniref:hypothetical protein n=1 Tax=Mycobacterium sp. E3339 TaxID=1834146 RepID=UPI0007FDD9BB|nr:hypothetical protein [Mycobacterium sp. E3339]OBG59080.1 hypothetical protein A5702_00280 [Mycobacterium sp. E3339]